MNALRYLPSTQFLVIVGSIALSGGLVLAAQWYTNAPHTPSSLASGAPSPQASNGDWQQTLSAIQQESGTTPLTPPSPETVNTLLGAAKTPNLTTTIGRSLLINVSAAKSQGLGSDMPTQDQLVETARQQIESAHKANQYASGDLTLAAQTSDASRAYGNAVMSMLQAHPRANYQDTIVAVGRATDSGSAAELAPLSGIEQEYRALTQALLATPVPPNLAPLHLKIVNDLALMTSSFDDMQAVLDDPLRGIAGLSIFDTTTGELGRLFISVGQSFAQNGILFSKDEPGSAWSALALQLSAS
ncbi:MAG TPA: hypothetical protein VHD37_02225 [Candidatus Paceibacterota bacterium]|nr:hypothetical protein [Candidatus Paceibacterota bacterium]